MSCLANRRKSFLRYATMGINPDESKRVKLPNDVDTTRRKDEDECLKQLEIIREEISDISSDNVRLTGQLKNQGLEFDKLKMEYLDDMENLKSENEIKLRNLESDNEIMVIKLRNLQFDNERLLSQIKDLQKEKTPESGWVCTDPYNQSDYTKRERINSCKKETGGVFDNKVKVPGGRFTNQAKCTETCYNG